MIREELGEDNTLTDADHFTEEVKELKASKEVKEKLNKEISRFKNMGMNSSESAVLRGYIETMLELPWDKASRDSSDLKRAEEILNADHYGMEQVKERGAGISGCADPDKEGQQPDSLPGGPARNR